MPYSMVGAPALGYDLARLAQGSQVATVVRTALHCTPRDLRLLAARRRDRTPYSSTVGYGPRPMREALASADEAVGLALAGEAELSAERLHRLETATLGSVEALDRFVRSEVLEWAWHDLDDLRLVEVAGQAADVLRDAAASAFTDAATAAWRRRMAAPFLGSGVRRVDDLTTGHAGVDDLLSTVAGLDAGGRAAWRAAVEECRPWTTTWAPAMHEACWALHLTDRLREAADAQMAAVLAFRAAGFTSRDASYGVWNALSGVVHATLVSDLLPPEDHESLTRVCRRARPGQPLA
jgi:hypothetical protein